MATLNATTTPVPIARHRGPHLGVLAVVYTILFLAGLYPVTTLAGKTPPNRDLRPACTPAIVISKEEVKRPKPRDETKPALCRLDCHARSATREKKGRSD